MASRYNSNPEVINVLLNNGADGSIKCEKGKMAFDYAKDNKGLKGTDAYWRLNDAQYE
ncbi:MAG: ankyrin repeat domain-containing protein [Candidatus Woesearchaeota archaeon]